MCPSLGLLIFGISKLILSSAQTYPVFVLALLSRMLPVLASLREFSNLQPQYITQSTDINSNCTTAEQQSAVQLQAALCAGQSASGSVSVRLSSATGSTALPSGSALSSLASSISASATSRPASSSGSAASASASGSGNVASSASSVLASASSSRAAGDKVAELKMGAMAVAGLVGVVGMAVGGLAVL